MMRQLLCSCVMVGTAATAAFASTAVSSAASSSTALPDTAGSSAAFAPQSSAAAAPRAAKVRITQQVLAGGKPLMPGTYEVVITQEHPSLPDGTPSPNQRFVELIHNGTVVAREIAEVFAAGERPVGTSGSPSASATVQRLRGDEYVRIAINAGESRYLVHLPTGQSMPQR
jgi:hypothetical protein